MHSSSELSCSSFDITRRGESVSHTEFFASLRNTDRLGILTPKGFEALGAITLIMSHVTAFYDRYREDGRKFFAYPDFFSFQRRQLCVDYGMCDIWPLHKNVTVPEEAQGTAEAIADRGVKILLVPDGDARDVAIEEVEMASLERNVEHCFAYAPTGKVGEPDLTISCASRPLAEWAIAVAESIPGDGADVIEIWKQQAEVSTLSQSFREIDVNGALARL